MGLGDMENGLKYLGLAQSRCPSVRELRAKLKKLKKNHHPHKNVVGVEENEEGGNKLEDVLSKSEDLLMESEEFKTPVMPSASEKQGNNQAGPSLKGGGSRGPGYEERGRGFEEPAGRGPALPNRWRGGPSNWGDHHGSPWEQNHHGKWGPYQ